jgi:two-component system phosphate regulon sensor histidine kinase PhoR
LDDKVIRKKYLKRADKGVERLIYIVNDLDMISKRSWRFGSRYFKFDIVELIENVFELLEMKAEKRKLRFRLRTTTYCLIM